eukprot:COSAG02_NODE_15505_length_1165_cov_0.871482_1_plen_34_part_10
MGSCTTTVPCAVDAAETVLHRQTPSDTVTVGDVP